MLTEMRGISADFSGCEIIVAAGLSGDRGLYEAETSPYCHRCLTDDLPGAPCSCPDKDDGERGSHTGLHWLAAHLTFGPGAVKENRYQAKAVIFRKLFGGAPDSAVAESIANVFDYKIAPVYKQWDDWLRKCYEAGSTVYRDYSGHGENYSVPLAGRRRYAIYRTYSGRQIYAGKGAHATGNYCLSPSTPVLRSDLRHVAASDIKVGDRLVAFDEYPGDSGSGNKYHRMRTAVAQTVSRTVKPSVKVFTADGKTTVCSTDHMWLVRRAKAPHRGPRIAWARADSLLADDMLLSVGTWNEDFSRTAGYLAGLFDGEGCLSSRGEGHRQTGLVFSQKPGITMDAFIKGMSELALPGNYRKRSPGSSTPTDSIQVTGIKDILQVLGTLQPARFQPRFEAVYEGAAVTAGLTDTVPVLSVEDAGDLELVSIQTSTRTLIANGYLSHNCIQGTARELLKDGINLWGCSKWGHLPILPVHDQVVCFVPADEADEAGQVLRTCMATDVLSTDDWNVHIDADLDEPFSAWPDSS